MIESHHHQGRQEGPRLAIMGGIHGNEVCGPIAIRRLIDELRRGEVKIERGELLLIPVANPKAYERRVRFIEENLNRVFFPTEAPASYEQGLAQELTRLLSGCDALLDLHSIHTPGWPFAMSFGFFSQAEEDFIQSLGLPYIVEGWEEAYAASLPGVNRGQSRHTAGFMRHIGKIAAGIECGQHDDPGAPDIGYQAIRRALAHFGLTDDTLLALAPAKRVRMQAVYMRESAADSLAQAFTHGQNLPKGDLIATRVDGSEIRMAEDGMILFPRPDCPVGEEYVYTGKLLT